MSVILGRIENKFWSNGSFKQPNGFPVYAEQEELKDAELALDSYLSGTLYAFGDQWNHCQYKGGYYALYMLLVLDEDRKYYLYRCEREIWFDVLKARAAAIGDLSTSNNDKLLEENLSKTFSILDNPARITTINFDEVDFDWRKNFSYKESTKVITQEVLSRKAFDNFFAAISNNFAKNWKKVDEVLYSGNKNPAVFILSSLKGSVTDRGWKEIIRKKINKFIKDISGDLGKNLKITKLKDIHDSKLTGNYCITWKVDGISQGEENLRLKEIDLSKLSDIKLVNLYDLKEIEPFTPLNDSIEEKGGLFRNVDFDDEEPPLFAKIRRKSYLPIGAGRGKRPEDGSTFGFIRQGFNWKFVKDPQEIIFDVGGREEKAFLWWLDNLNFQVAYNTVGQLQSVYDGTWRNVSYRNIDDEYYYDNTYFENPYPWAYVNDPFSLLTKSPVPFGFLIFGLKRRYSEWKLFEYIGNSKLEKFEVFSGIKKTFLRNYEKQGQWWSILNENLKKIQPSDYFTKFYLDNFLFIWLAFFPWSEYSYLTDPYLYEDHWGTWKHTNNNYYVQSAIASDVYDSKGAWKLVNPFNDSRFLGYRTKVDNNLDKLFIFDFVNFPKGLELEKGDYLFSNEEYEIKRYPLKKDGLNLYNLASEYKSYGWTLLECFRKLFRVEDFLDVSGSSEFVLPKDSKQIFLCTNLEGNIDIRSIEDFSFNVSLSSSGNQIVKSVDGEKSKNITFTLMKKLSDNLLNPHVETITSGLKSKVLRAFYASHGYKTKIVGEVAHWTWLTEADFAESNSQQYLFDLVGTDWYCLFTRGRCHLIAKSTNNFEPQTGKTQRLKHSENKDLNFSLIEKINQRVRFQFWTIPYYLSWKTTFTDEDRISLFYGALEPTDLQTEFNQYFIKLDTGFDTIWYENVSIPKKRDKSLGIANSIAVEKLQLDLVRDQYQYQIDQNKYELAQKRYMESIKRAEIDLYHHKIKAGIDLATAGVGGIVMGAVKAKRPLSPRVITRKKVVATDEGYSYHQLLRASLANAGRARLEYYTPDIKSKTISEKVKIKGSNLPLLAAGAATAAVNRIAGAAFNFAATFPEIERRIGVDKKLNAEELAIQGLVMDTTHMDRQLKSQLALNQITNTFDNPMINEAHILEEFRNKTEWHGKKLAPAYLVVYTPSEIQLKYLKSHKEEFGVMCDIPNVEINFYDGMPGDIIRFRNLDQEGIKRISNPIVREYLQSKLIAGVHIVPITKQTYKLLTGGEYRERIYRLNQDLYEKSDQIKQKEGEILTLTNKYNTAKEEGKQEAKQECAKEASELQKQIQELENNLNNVNNTLKEKIKELEDEKDDLEEQLKNCEANVVNIGKAKETCDRVNADEIKSLKAKLKECEEKIKEKQIELDAKEAGLKASVNRADNLSAEYKTLERHRNELLNEVGLYKERALECEKKIKELGVKEKSSLEKLFEGLQEYMRGESIEGMSLEQAIDFLKGKLKDRNEEISKLKSVQSGLLEEFKKQKQELIDSCTQQKENLENQKSDIQRQLRECLANKGLIEEKNKQYEADIAGLKQKLETARTAAAGNCPSFGLDICELMKDMAFDSRYEIDIKERESRLSAFTDIAFEIVHNTKWIKLSRIDQNLSSKYPEIRDLFTHLDSLNTINPLPLCEECVQDKNWHVWQDVLLGLLASNEDQEKAELDKFSFLTPKLNNVVKKARWLPNLHAFKKGLDRLNASTHKAYENLKDKFDEDPDLDHFFKHFYPGQRVKNLYKALFGLDMEFANVKRAFLAMSCPKSGEPGADDFDLGSWIEEAKKRYELQIKGVDLNATKVPPTTNTIYFSDGGNLFIELNKAFRYYFPLVQSNDAYKVPYETYYTYSNNKLQRSSIRGRALKEAKVIKQTYYNRGGRNWVWCKFRTEKFDSKENAGYVGEGDSREVYFRVREKGILYKINQNYRSLIINIEKIALPDHVNERINNNQDLIRSFVIRNWDYYNADSPEDASGIVTINLTKTFGKRIIPEKRERADVIAWKLMGILDASKLWLNKVGTYDSLKAYQLEGRYWDTSDDVLKNNKEFQYYFDDKRRNINVIGENMFVDLRAFMSWILKAISYISRYDDSYYSPYSIQANQLWNFIKTVEDSQG